MSVSFFSNLNSLRIAGRLNKTSSQLGSVYQQLSSGSRISKPADDPAGLALADRLNMDSRLMNVALRNSNDAVALSTITDSALGEINNILQRMSELAIQGSSSSYTTTQRSTMQSEFTALGSEIDRISATTNFNSINLLSASSDLTAQIGIANDANSRLIIPSAIAALVAIGLGTGTTLTYSLTGTSTAYAVSASQTAYSAVQNAISKISTQRGAVDAITSRLYSAINVVTAQRDVTTEAEANIRDVDIASKASALVRLQVLQQTQTSLLAQANQTPALVLNLLR